MRGSCAAQWFFITFVMLAALRFPHAQQSAHEQSGETSRATPGAFGCKLHAYNGAIPLDQLENYFKGAEDLRGGMTCAFRISPTLPVFTFRVPGQADNTLDDIEIREAGGETLLQIIENSTDPGSIFPAPAIDVLKVVDTNFDGYQDLQILNNCGATGNCFYDYYAYEPTSRKFVHDDFLSNLSTPSFDKTKKQLMTSSNGSVSDWEKDVYQFENGKYTLIHREVSTWDRDQHKVNVSTYELRDGQMTVVDSTSEPE